MTQIRYGLVQNGVVINTITCTLEVYGHFKFVDEGICYIHSRPHNVTMY